MGRATIVSGGTDGQYTVTLNYDKRRVTQRIAALETEIARVDEIERVQAYADLLEAQNDLAAVNRDIDEAINDWESAPEWTPATAYVAGNRVALGLFVTAIARQRGTSGASPPIWPGQHGETVRDNGVEWAASAGPTGAGHPAYSLVQDYTLGQTVTAVVNFGLDGGGDPQSLYATASTSGRSGYSAPAWAVGTVLDGGIIWERQDQKEALTELIREVGELGKLVRQRQGIYTELKTKLLALQKEKAYLENNTPHDPVVSAWCVDLTEDLGENLAVGTLEIPNERHDLAVLIRPAFVDEDRQMRGAEHDAALDGQLQPSIASTGAGLFYNWAMHPGWQKWRPLYRLGTLTAITDDRCSVALDEATSSDQALDVNQATTLADVPIDYMFCHGAAFSVNDRVVVEFKEQDWSEPHVIGFESHPKSCGFPGFFATPLDADGADPRLYFSHPSGVWRARALDINRFNTTWRGSGHAVSWSGAYGRNVAPRPDQQVAEELAPGEYNVTLAQVIEGYNTKIDHIYKPTGSADFVAYWRYHNFSGYIQPSWTDTVLYIGGGLHVTGAAIQQSGGKNYIIAATESSSGRITINQAAFYRYEIGADTPEWVLIGEHSFPEGVSGQIAGWFFNDAGTEARCVVYDFLATDDPTEWSTRVYSAALTGVASVSVLEVSTAYPGQGVMTRTQNQVWSSCETLTGTVTDDRTDVWTGKAVVAVDYKNGWNTCVMEASGTEDYSAYFEADTALGGTGGLSVTGSSDQEQFITVGGQKIPLSKTVSSGTRTTRLKAPAGLAMQARNDVTLTASQILFLDLRTDQCVYGQRVKVTAQTSEKPDSGDGERITDIAYSYRLFSTTEGTLFAATSADYTVETVSSVSELPYVLCYDDEGANDATDFSVTAFHLTLLIDNPYNPRTAARPEHLFVSCRKRFIPDYEAVIGSLDDDRVNYLTGGDPVTLAGLGGSFPRFNGVVESA